MPSKKTRSVLNLSSKHKPEALIKRIQAGADIKKIWFLPAFGSKPFIVSVKGRTFQLRKRRTFWAHGGFAPTFYGFIQPQGKGSQIKGRFWISLPTHLFLAVVFLTLALSAAALFIDGQLQGSVPLLGIVLCILVLKFGLKFSPSILSEISIFLTDCAGN